MATSNLPIVISIIMLSCGLRSRTLLFTKALSHRQTMLSAFTPRGFSILKLKQTTHRRVITSRSTPTMMPEGPEVRTLVDQLQPAVGRRLVDLSFVSGRYTRHGKPKGFEDFRNTMNDFRTQDSSEWMECDTVQEWKAKGKFIYLILDEDVHRQKGQNEILETDEDYLRSIWITLGMSGRFVRDAFDASLDDGTTHKQARWYFEFLDDEETGSTRKIYYYDTRNFGTLRFSLSRKELMDKLYSLGPDILMDDECTEELFLDIMDKQRSSTNICKFLMNQSKIAGVGNYILSEALYRSNLDPFASLSELDQNQRRLLHTEILKIASESYASQGVTRQKGGSYRQLDGSSGSYSFSLQCYGQKACPKGKNIIRETNGPHGRTIWYVEDQLFMPRDERESDAGKDLVVKKGKSSTGNSIPMQGQESSDIRISGVRSNFNLADSIIETSWRHKLQDFLTSEKFDQLSRFVKSERENGSIFPPSDEVFAALNACPFDEVKVVIIGQDPYHGQGQGHGLAFSVLKGVPPPPSLKNIFKEAVDDCLIDYPEHGNLMSWTEQGVLLLNTVLTVRQGKANSHKNVGWEDFTDEIVNVLNTEKKGLVFQLWGASAAKKGKNVDKNKHTVIVTSHPSPLGATKTNAPFLGSKCFSRCNAALEESGLDLINWNVH